MCERGGLGIAQWFQALLLRLQWSLTGETATNLPASFAHHSHLQNRNLNKYSVYTVASKSLHLHRHFVLRIWRTSRYPIVTWQKGGATLWSWSRNFQPKVFPNSFRTWKLRMRRVRVGLEWGRGCPRDARPLITLPET